MRRRRAKFGLLCASIPVLCAVVLYGLALVRYCSGRSTLTRNLAAELNAPILAVPESDRAWPIYRKAVLSTAPLSDAGLEIWPPMPSDEIWPEAAAWIEQNHPLIREVWRAGEKPCFGAFYSDLHDPGIELRDPDSQPPGPASGNPAVLDLYYPWLGKCRAIARWLKADATFAAVQGDGSRGARDIVACYRLAEQLSGDKPQIVQLVSIAIASVGAWSLGLSLEMNPNIFSDAELSAIAEAVERADPLVNRVATGFERAQYDDFAQRLFTDDGNGDGYLGIDGDRLAFDLAGESPTLLRHMVAPIMTYRFTRRAFLQERDDLFGLVEATHKIPYWDRITSPTSQLDAAIARMSGKTHPLSAWNLESSISRRLEFATLSMLQFEGARLTIAAHRHRLRSGRFPESAPEIPAELFSRTPVDLCDGKPLRLRVIGSALVVYSVGADLADDAATPPSDQNPHMAFVKGRNMRGDVILFPPLHVDDDGSITSPGPWPSDRRRPAEPPSDVAPDSNPAPGESP